MTPEQREHLFPEHNWKIRTVRAW